MGRDKKTPFRRCFRGRFFGLFKKFSIKTLKNTNCPHASKIFKNKDWHNQLKNFRGNLQVYLCKTAALFMLQKLAAGQMGIAHCAQGRIVKKKVRVFHLPYSHILKLRAEQNPHFGNNRNNIYNKAHARMGCAKIAQLFQEL